MKPRPKPKRRRKPKPSALRRRKGRLRRKARLEAEAKAREEARLKAEAEAKRIAEEQRIAAEKAKAEAAAKARELARLQAEAEAQAHEAERLKAEAEAKRVAEEKRIAAEKAKAEAASKIVVAQAAPAARTPSFAMSAKVRSKISNVDIVNRSLDRSEMTIGVEFAYAADDGMSQMGVDFASTDEPAASSYFASPTLEIGKSSKNFVLFPVKFSPPAGTAPKIGSFRTDKIWIYLLGGDR